MLESDSALYKWFSKAIHSEQQLKPETIQNPKLFYELIKDIPGISPIEFTKQNQHKKPWQTNYTNYKSIFYAIQNYYRAILKSSFPIGLPSVNLIQIAKGNDKDGLYGLLIVFFIACINSGCKQKYITYIMELNEGQQLELMNLINQKNLMPIQSTSQDTTAYKQRIEQNKIDQLFFKIQSLSSQNQSLNLQFTAQSEQKIKMKEVIKKLESDNKKLKKQIDENALYLQQKQQQQFEQQSSRRVIRDSNQQVIKQLKKQLIEQQKKHLQQKGQLKQQIQQLRDKYFIAQDKISQLQNLDLGGINTGSSSPSNKKIQHQDCISVNQHKNITRKLQMMVKEFQQKETMLERELARAKYENDQLNRKYKKEEKQKQNIKVEYQKISNNQHQMISQRDAEKIKISVLQALRNKLKEKLEDNGKQNQQQKAN